MNEMSIDEIIDLLTLTEKEKKEISQLAPVYDAVIGYLEELKEFKELGVTPEQIRKISEWYRELATEHGKLKKELERERNRNERIEERDNQNDTKNVG